MSFTRWPFLLVVFAGMATASGGVSSGVEPEVLSAAEAVRQGRALVADLLSRQPAAATNTGIMILRSGRERRETPVRFTVVPRQSGRVETYEASVDSAPVLCTIVHAEGQPNRYRLSTGGREKELSAAEAMISFGESDFWLADLGLEFLNWPEQRLIRKEMRRGQACSVLESVNPAPSPGGYSRVVSWIEMDTPGIINAEAYDHRNRLLKEFAASEFKKVNGQWELQEIEMINRQSRTQTTIRFDVSRKGSM